MVFFLFVVSCKRARHVDVARHFVSAYGHAWAFYLMRAWPCRKWCCLPAEHGEQFSCVCVCVFGAGLAASLTLCKLPQCACTCMQAALETGRGESHERARQESAVSGTGLPNESLMMILKVACRIVQSSERAPLVLLPALARSCVCVCVMI